MELFNILISSYLIAFSGAIMPGPLMTGTLSKAAEIGVKAGPLYMIGHALLELALVVLLLLGLGPLLQKDGFVIAISFLGAAILICMGAGMLKSLPKLSLDFTPAAKKNNSVILSGALLSLANPYWIIWWATIGIGYLIVSQNFGIIGVAAFFIGHISGDLTWYTFLSFIMAKSRKFLKLKFYRILIGFCAALLLFFAVLFTMNGIKKL